MSVLRLAFVVAICSGPIDLRDPDGPPRVRRRGPVDHARRSAQVGEILTDYPYLEPEDISAVLEYAARQAAGDNG